MSDPLRSLPAVHEVLDAAPLAAARSQLPHALVVDVVRREISVLRRTLDNGAQPTDAATLAQRVADALERDLRPTLRKVINATGILLHTNLGRAPMASDAARAAFDAARGYVNLELDLDTGKRSSRQSIVRRWLCHLTGAESATAVNNNAAATVIALRSLAAGREVIVSRGQLVEIGGSFRIPEIMAVSGAILREVGTTNITRIADYEAAITSNTAALLRVHTSNFRVTGFTESATLGELVALGKRNNLPVIDDVGSGALVDVAPFGMHGEPLVRDSVTTGADLVLFSGDKLLGGPQAGVLVGRSDLIQAIERDPLMRAFRLDKMTLAALEATLRLLLCGKRTPLLEMLARPASELRTAAETLARRLNMSDVDVREDVSYAGGGTLPDRAMPTWVVTVGCHSEADFARRLRLGEPAVMARIAEGRVIFDMRTVFAEDMDGLVTAIQQAAVSTPLPFGERGRG